ncbi:hypothetical protein E4U58_007357 [Claviceps cyperi]|nr:hypothetical protein E4U58_007357 [Claviceps cyperi]
MSSRLCMSRPYKYKLGPNQAGAVPSGRSSLASNMCLNAWSERWRGFFDDPANQATQRTRRENVDAAHCADLFERLGASSRAHLRDSASIGWSRLNKFYESLSRSPPYAAAVILHPALGIN